MAIALTPPRSAPRSARRRLPVGKSLAWVYLVGVLFITIFPFYWVLRTALSNNYSLDTHPSSILPTGFTWGGFERVLGISSQAEALAQGGSGAAVNLGVYLRNSLIYASVLTFCVVLCSAMAAYAFARLHWRGRNVVFSIFLCALMIPGILTLMPNFVFIKNLGLVNSFAGLILPGALFSAFDIFFLRQFMLGLSTEIEEAAILDGAGRLTGPVPHRAADDRGPDDHADAAHLHQHLERLLLAAADRQQPVASNRSPWAWPCSNRPHRRRRRTGPG